MPRPKINIFRTRKGSYILVYKVFNHFFLNIINKYYINLFYNILKYLKM